MKNRKLFAIITLVAFMLTMMPLMAFATTGSGSSISVDDSSAKANGTDALEFIIDFDAALTSVVDADKVAAAQKALTAAQKAIEAYNKDAEADAQIEITDDGATAPEGATEKVAGLAAAYNDAVAALDNAGQVANAAGNQFVVVFAERSGSLSDVDNLSAAGAIAPQAGVLIFNNITAAGEKTIKVTSTTAGTVALRAYVVTDSDYGTTSAKDTIATLYNGSSDFIKTAFVGNGCTGKFVAQDNKIEADVTITSVTDAKSVRANNGVDYYKVSMKFTKGGSKLVGEDVTISVDKNGATLNKEEATTSATGKVEFKVSATKEGTYKVTVDCGTYSEDFNFTFTSAQIDKVNITYTVGGTIAVDATETVAMQVVAYDSNGNAVSADADLAKTLNDDFVIECTSAPADSALKDSTDFTFVYNPNTSDNIYISFEPDAEGTFNFKIYNDTTGVASTTSINAAEFGVTDHATISYPAASYMLGEQSQAATVYVYDQNGVKKLATSKKFSYSGVGVSAFNSNNGQVTFKNDNDYVGNEIVVSVVANNKYAASATLTIGAEAAALKFEPANGAVGEDVVVKAQVVDLNGNNTAIAAQGNYDVSLQSAIITHKEDQTANVSVDADSLVESKANLLKKGTGKVTITSNKEGTYKATVVLALTNTKLVTIDGKDYKPGAYTFYLSGEATATFGPVVPDNSETSTVTLIIGSNTFVANGEARTTDVAPYVVNGRTFVPVRAFAEATGAKVEYDAATQVITITGEGITAQMTIGSNILTVNGETVVMDAAAAVTAEGRTVLPVRYAGQALGYDFECAYGSNGAVTSVTMFK